MVARPKRQCPHLAFHDANSLQDAARLTWQNGFVVRTFVLLAVVSTGAFAQRPPDMPVTPEERTRIILAASDRIERYYVDVAA